MRERPILFTGEMVRAVLAGAKTQTRRIVKPQPPSTVTRADVIPWPNDTGSAVLWLGDGPIDPLNGMDYKQRHPRGWVCPYGMPGDRLWVREAFTIGYQSGHDSYSAIPPTGSDERRDGKLFYSASFPERADEPQIRWRPSIHMPRWAARITLEITDVRAQRLYDATIGDIAEEGIRIPVTEEGKPLVRLTGKHPPTDFLKGKKLEQLTGDDLLRAEWASVWSTINGRASWDANPWVWTISFMRVLTA